MVIRIGGFKRHIPLPRYAKTYKDVTAKMDGNYLDIILGGKKDGRDET